MKRMILAAVLALVVVGIAVASIYYVNQSIDEICHTLSLSTQYAKQDDMEETRRILETANQQWQQRRTVLMMFIEQDLLDEVDNQLAYMDALTKFHKEEYIPATVLCISQLREIQNRENYTVNSWF